MKKTFTSLICTAFILCFLGTDAAGRTRGKPGTRLETENTRNLRPLQSLPWKANMMMTYYFHGNVSKLLTLIPNLSLPIMSSTLLLGSMKPR